MRQSTKRYTTRTADAPWIKCDKCGGQSAISIKVEVQGGHGRKGSRSLGYYCSPCGEQRLAELCKKTTGGRR
jgi:hypothetical protein